MKNIMTRAWEIAKEAVVKFGGRSVEYIAGALKQAWAEVKKGVENMKQLKGSEKQIAWAEDIREGYLNAVEAAKAHIHGTKEHPASVTVTGLDKEVKEISSQKAKELKKFVYIMKAEEKLAVLEAKVQRDLQEVEASFWIDEFQHLSTFGK